MNTTFNPSRRKFVLTSAAIGGGFALGLQMPGKAQDVAAGNDVNIWVQISPDDTVTIKYARCEMGQGSMTSAPQLVADELDASWDLVHSVYVDVYAHFRMARGWGVMVTVGRPAIPTSYEY